MPATAADIPTELYNLILSFFKLEVDQVVSKDDEEDDKHENEGEIEVEEEHEVKEVKKVKKDANEDDVDRDSYGERNYVRINKRELGWLTLVCRQWVPLCQPRIFQQVTLRNRDDVESLLALLANPKCRIANYVQTVYLYLSVATYPYPPWIHTVHVRLIPKLLRFREVKETTVTGPLPAGQSFSSIHGVLPTCYPFFAAGIDRLILKDLHFKSFGHLVRLLKELPSLEKVKCENVAWDRSPDTPLPVTTSYVGKNTDWAANYEMRGCTDNAAVCWLSWLLAPTLSGRLDQQDSDTLCHIASDVCKDVDAARLLDWYVVSRHLRDRLWFGAEDVNGNRLIPWVEVHLTSTVPGERTRRRVRAIHLWFYDIDVSTVVGWDCWSAIDAQLATLPSLRTIVIQTWEHDDLVLFSSDVVTSKMSQLRESTKLKYAHGKSGSYLWYTHDTVDSKAKGRRVEDTDDLQ